MDAHKTRSASQGSHGVYQVSDLLFQFPRDTKHMIYEVHEKRGITVLYSIYELIKSSDGQIYESIWRL